jgi:hypothetical protein
MVALGALLIGIGLLLAIPRGMFPGSTSNVDLSGGHAFPSPRNTRDNQRPRGKLDGVLIGLGFMALGGVCIAFG